MFDFSFGELLLTGTVALVVIGPERLPKVARTVGAMIARAQRYVNAVKSDIQREIELDNLRQLEAEMNEAGRKLGNEVMGNLNEAHQSLQTTAQEVQSALSEPPAAHAAPASPPGTVITDAQPLVHEDDAAPHLPSAEAIAAAVAEQQFDLFSPPPASPAERPARDRR